jgi:hypothetical protein
LSTALRGKRWVWITFAVPRKIGWKGCQLNHGDIANVDPRYFVLALSVINIFALLTLVCIWLYHIGRRFTRFARIRKIQSLAVLGVIVIGLCAVVGVLWGFSQFAFEALMISIAILFFSVNYLVMPIRFCLLLWALIRREKPIPRLDRIEFGALCAMGIFQIGGLILLLFFF